MAEYRRAYVPGGSWFFTVNLAERKINRLLVEKIDLLRSEVGCADCKEAHQLIKKTLENRKQTK